jgi:hypothetical protein
MCICDKSTKLHGTTSKNDRKSVEGGRKCDKYNCSYKKTCKLHEIIGREFAKLFLGNQRIPEASSCKYLGKIISNYLSWDD